MRGPWRRERGAASLFANLFRSGTIQIIARKCPRGKQADNLAATRAAQSFVHWVKRKKEESPHLQRAQSFRAEEEEKNTKTREARTLGPGGRTQIPSEAKGLLSDRRNDTARSCRPAMKPRGELNEQRNAVKLEAPDPTPVKPRKPGSREGHRAPCGSAVRMLAVISLARMWALCVTRADLRHWAESKKTQTWPLVKKLRINLDV